jgi:hypothetical protein
MSWRVLGLLSSFRPIRSVFTAEADRSRAATRRNLHLCDRSSSLLNQVKLRKWVPEGNPGRNIFTGVFSGLMGDRRTVIGSRRLQPAVEFQSRFQNKGIFRLSQGLTATEEGQSALWELGGRRLYSAWVPMLIAISGERSR